MTWITVIGISATSMIATCGNLPAGFLAAAIVTMICIPATIGGTIHTIGINTTHTTTIRITTGTRIDIGTGIKFF